MTKTTKTPFNLGLFIGILGLTAGVLLIFQDQILIGVFGAIASAGIAYQGYVNSKNKKL